MPYSIAMTTAHLSSTHLKAVNNDDSHAPHILHTTLFQFPVLFSLSLVLIGLSVPFFFKLASMNRNKDQVKKDSAISQFRSITGANREDSTKFLKKYNYRLDVAVDAFYADPSAMAQVVESQERENMSVQGMSQKLSTLFDAYKDPSGDSITVDGTIKLCADLGVDPEDVVLLALAYELKSPGVAEWSRSGWVDGFKALRVDSLVAIKALLPQLRNKLAQDPEYFKKVYLYTFQFARSEGARSLSAEMALPFWQLLLPIGLSGKALSHVDDLTSTEPKSTFEGWKPEHSQWWFDFLEEKGTKGISKDTWNMFLDFVRTIDSRFERHDLEAAWPSLIDDFVEHAKTKVVTSG